METLLRSEHPQRWSLPSVRISASKPSGQTALAAAGWHRELLSWEQHWPADGGVSADVGDITLSVLGNPELLTQGDATREIEIVLDSSGDLAQYRGLLEATLPKVIFAELESLPDFSEVTINANRELELPPSWHSLQGGLLDLPLNTLPSTRAGSLPLISSTRWVRVIRWNEGILTIWNPAEGHWKHSEVRWPHNGIPSRTREWVRDAQRKHMSPPERLYRWMQDCVRHETYYLQTWEVEVERWESHLFAELASGDQAFETLDIPRLQRDIGVLAQYLTSVRQSQRAYLRRSEVVSLARDVPEVQKILKSAQQTLDSDITHARSSLRAAFELLNTTSQGAQTFATSKSQEATERMNQLITRVTAILFVPSLVAGIYGTNILELSPGSTGSLLELLGLMAGASFVSFGVISWIRLSRVSSHAVYTLGIGITIVLATLLGRIDWWAPLVAAAVGIVSTLALGRLWSAREGRRRVQDG